jgi:hypothetical protein
MNPFSSVGRRPSIRLALASAAALSLVALPACGSDDNNTPSTVLDTTFGTTAPIDNSTVGNAPSAPGDTTTVGSMAPGATTP